MGRDNQRNAVILFREDPAKVAVPGVAMNQIGIDVGSVKVDAALDRPKNGTKWFGTGERVGIHLEAGHGESPLLQTLIAKAAHIDIHGPGQFAREIIDMYSSAAINVRRIFVSQKKNLRH